ncbi:MAG: pre-16S rRNA-processing nuclease YqgF [Oscillatoriaceae bacterium SKW80]|nr:pre-16S rRNA-processing nuclease YqgF [Oscillatoriaceae bacterium SKYG93]MCX8120035.1 pre-16S rRNA-processing nuclease YqgF [Oscillatoriaceae bacterium SKW80]MDW8454039.1 pre-16S rRNA-processing nuclease YqgF [Oscillatoriaceae cyanobacterium SKYGB_i_bin93]HIK29724.1 pre-16S rRNA-processing nuclease YqgF [Oscillatoriaceae cyanobacterium M7585_C2015_266]
MSNSTDFIIGFDPGRQKCGIAVMRADRQVVYHQVVPSEEAIATIQSLCQKFPIHQLVIGDQTSSKTWKQQLASVLNPSLSLIMVDERYSTLEARDRYWQMYPPKGLLRFLPKGMRQPPRPIDDIVAIVLIERYLAKK